MWGLWQTDGFFSENERSDHRRRQPAGSIPRRRRYKRNSHWFFPPFRLSRDNLIRCDTRVYIRTKNSRIFSSRILENGTHYRGRGDCMRLQASGQRGSFPRSLPFKRFDERIVYLAATYFPSSSLQGPSPFAPSSEQSCSKSIDLWNIHRIPCAEVCETVAKIDARKPISITFELPQVDNLLTIDPRMRIVISNRRVKILTRIHLGNV